MKKLSQDPNHIIYLYFSENINEVFGLIRVELYECLFMEKGYNILSLAGNENYKGKGIGKNILNFIEDMSRDQKYNYIRTNSSIEREKVHKFYEYLGYTGNKLQKRFIKYMD